MNTRKKFVLKKEALRELTEQEMTEVAGGLVALTRTFTVTRTLTRTDPWTTLTRTITRTTILTR